MTIRSRRPAPTAARPAALPPPHPTHLRSVVLHMVNDCNLACTYCYAEQGTYGLPGARLSLETGRSAIQLAISSAVEAGGDRVTIGFFGGEPLLAFETIRQLVDFAEAAVPPGLRLRFVTTTNGTLLSRHVSFLADHEFEVTVSLDGNPHQNAQRLYRGGRATYSEVVAGVQDALTRMPLTGRITIHEHNTDIAGAIAHLRRLGFQRLTFALDYSLSDRAFWEFRHSLTTAVDDYMDAIRGQDFYELTNISQQFVALALRRPKPMGCSAGAGYLAVSASGALHKCPRFVGDPATKLGDVSRSRVVFLGRTVSTIEGMQGPETASECRTCPARPMCGGGCEHHARSAMRTGGDGGDERAPLDCAFRWAIAEESLRLAVNLPQASRAALLRYLSECWSVKAHPKEGQV